MTEQLGSLDCVMLRTRDVQSLVAEYQVVLGAIPIDESYPDRARIRLGNIDVGVQVHAEGPGERGTELVFRVHDVVALRAHLAGSPFEVRGYDAVPGGVRLLFNDPAGNALAVVQWGARLDEVEAASTDPQS